LYGIAFQGILLSRNETMKRTLFLASGAAATLAGCGGMHQSTGLLPQTGAQSAAHTAAGTAAVPISPDVLAHPIIGQAERWDAAAAPPGWMLAEGQTLEISANPLLFSVLGKSAGGDGKTTFKLPATKQRWIVAIAGSYPRTPAALENLRPDRTRNGVSVRGMTVTLPVVFPPAPAKAAVETKPLWYPGTVPTAEQVAEQQRVEQTVRFDAKGPNSGQ